MPDKQTSVDLNFLKESDRVMKAAALCSLAGFTESGEFCKGCPYEQVPSYCTSYLCRDVVEVLKRYHVDKFGL